MASLMENLIDILNQEGTEYEELLVLSQKKTPVIVRGDLEELQEITDDEQNLASRIAHLEKTRVEITADIANVLNKDVNSLKLRSLIEMLDGRPEEQVRLAQAHDRLQSVVRGLMRTNEQNKELLANAMEMVEFELTLLQAARTAPETANYTRGAYSSGTQMGVQSGAFDAKQ